MLTNAYPAEKRQVIAMSATIMFLAFAVRLCALFAISPLEFVFDKYLVLAEQLQNNCFIATRAFSYSPLYCYFLAFTRTIFEHSLVWLCICQIMVGSINCVLLFFICRQLLPVKVAFGAGLVFCFYYSFVLYEVSFLSDFLGVALQVALVASLYWITGKRDRWLLLPGTILGLCILQRTNSLLLLILVAVLQVDGNSTVLSLKRLGLLLAAALLTLMPVALQNMLIMGEPGITATNPGYILYSSNNYSCNGCLYYPPWMLFQAEKQQQQDFAGDAEISTTLSSMIAGRTMDLRQSSQFYLRYVLNYISNYPQDALLLMARKLWMAFHGYEPHDTLPVIAKHNIVGYIAFIRYFLVLPFAVLGLVFSLYYWRRWLAVYLVIINQLTMLLLFYVVVRFRLPLEAMMLVLAAFACYRLYQLATKREWRKFAIAIAVVVFASLAGNYFDSELRDFSCKIDARDDFMLGQAAYNTQNYVQAAHYFQKVVDGNNSLHVASSHHYLARIYHKWGWFAQSKRQMQAVVIAKNNWFHTLSLKASRGNITLEQAQHLIELYKQRQQYPQALQLAHHTLLRKQSHPVIRYHLAHLQMLNGKLAIAGKQFAIAIRDGLLFTRYGLPACYFLWQLHRKQFPQRAKFYYRQACRQQAMVKWYKLDEVTRDVLQHLPNKK